MTSADRHDPVDVLLTGATQLLSMFRAKSLSPAELMRATLERIEDLNPQSRAIVDVYRDDAVSQAEAATDRYFRGTPAGPLDGLPVAVKDETPIAGRRTTKGSLLFGHEPDSKSSVVVTRIQEAGGIIHARTATPEMCCVAFTHSRRWGVTTNPWNMAYSPGGSSGGAGAALALGMTALAEGSDSGGSLRIPAAFCGVVGYKPPYGRVPGVPPAHLDTYRHQGPMARTVYDCALLEDVIAGPTSVDPVTIPERVVVSGAGDDISGWKIAVTSDCGGFPLSDEVRSALQGAVETLRALGARVDHVQVGWSFEEVQDAARIHAAMTFGSDLERLAATHSSEMTVYAIDIARRAGRVSRSEYAHGLRLESRIQMAVARIFADYDVLLCPTVTATGLKAGENYTDYGPQVDELPTSKVRDVLPTLIFNICNRNPAISVPIGVARNGIPIGMQIVGPPYGDQVVFRAAAAWQEAQAWPLAHGSPTPLGATARTRKMTTPQRGKRELT